MPFHQVICNVCELSKSVREKMGIACLAVLFFVMTMAVQAQDAARDPGPRGAPVGAGQPVQGLSTDQLRYFTNGAARFVNVEPVANGLGPSFNLDSCGGCHSQPANGGSSPSLAAFPNVGPNPQVALATANGATNKVPSFITSNGPIREVRFKFVVQNGHIEHNRPDGSVHDLFTIAGRQDAPGCVYPQEDFADGLEDNNLAFRIPTPTFGGGLMEAIDEATILLNMNSNLGAKHALGIHGVPNYNGNDATIARFGWKAQNKSLVMFSHEAYNVEIGETNEMFPNKRGFFPNPPPAACIYNALPEDSTNFLPTGSDTAAVPSDDIQFAVFMRYLDQPVPACTGVNCSPSIRNGSILFNSVVKCALCHTPSMTTTKNSVFGAGISNVQANLLSDLLIHHMGTNLADGISQGNAGPDQFRTAPLWGLGQRVFFLHDGRSTDLLDAIRQHASQGSEANGVIHLFNQLNETQKQDLLNYLRSL